MLRSVARHAGIEAVERHWPGTQDGFAGPILRLIGDLPSGTPVAFESALGWS